MMSTARERAIKIAANTCSVVSSAKSLEFARCIEHMAAVEREALFGAAELFVLPWQARRPVRLVLGLVPRAEALAAIARNDNAIEAFGEALHERDRQVECPI